DACAIICQIAGALDCAHQENLVHRDVKPENIMLGLDGRVTLLDFGLARIRHNQGSSNGLTAPGGWMGTPDYMAKEQWSDFHNVGPRSDTYGLGCTLYAILTGQPPFSGPNFDNVDRKRRAHFDV